MAELPKIQLTHPVDVNGEPKSEIVIRHARLRGDDFIALQQYARRQGWEIGEIDKLLQEGDLGTMLALLDSLCHLPLGTCGHIDAEDLPKAMEVLGSFLAPSPPTGAE